MALVHNRKTFGLFENGCFQDETNNNFTSFDVYTNDSLSGSTCCGIVNRNTYGYTTLGNQLLEVDPVNKYYQFGCSVKTIQQSYNNRNGSGHLGFACYDKNKTFIDLRNCGDIGNTTLSRTASPGDSIIYFTSASNWYTGADVTNYLYYFRQILFFPPSHPDYGVAWKYTRFNNRSYYKMEQTEQGDWAVYLENYSGSQTNYGNAYASTLPDYGYALPAGTPVSRGVAGGTYNYALGAPVYPTEWTTYTTPPFTGENRNSSYPFRYSTKYIRFLNLTNYNYRSETAGDSARYLLDNILLVECPNGKAWPNSLFSRTKAL